MNYALVTSEIHHLTSEEVRDLKLLAEGRPSFSLYNISRCYIQEVSKFKLGDICIKFGLLI